jgi:ABC-type glycerol-3-phosphate transport system substrate-binding protein
MNEKRLSRREFLQRAAGVGLGAAAAGMLGGCVVPAAPTPAGAPAPQATVAPPPAAKVSLVYWSEPRFQNVKGKEEQTKNSPSDYERLLASDFMAQNPNVTIEAEALAWEDLVTKVAAAIAAGTPPDVLKDYLGRSSKYANQDLLEPLESAIPQGVYNDFLPSLRGLYTIKGHLHALPVYFWITSIWGNTLPFKEANAEDKMPNPDGTWTPEQFTSALEALAVPDKRWPLGLQFSSEQGDYTRLGFFWANGAVLYKDGDYSKTAFNSPEAVEALARLVEWNNSGYIVPGATTIPLQDLDNAFYQGQVVIGGGNPGNYTLLETAQKEGRVTVDWEPFYALFPQKEGVKSAGLAAGPTGVMVFKQGEDAKRTAAVDFATFLVGPDLEKEYAINSNQFPTRTSAGNPFEGDEVMSRYVEWSQKYGVEDMGLGSPAYAEVRVVMVPLLQAALLGKMTPEEALAEYEKQANEILAKYA